MKFNNLVNFNLRPDRFINFKELNISNNSLISFKIKSGVLPNLLNLNLSQNEIKIISLSCLNLKILNISNNPINVLQIKYLPKLKKIFNSFVNFSKSKIISRNRIYLLCESKVGTPEGLSENLTKGAVEDGLCESKDNIKEGTQNGLTNKEICYRC